MSAPLNERTRFSFPLGAAAWAALTFIAGALWYLQCEVASIKEDVAFIRGQEESRAAHHASADRREFPEPGPLPPSDPLMPTAEPMADIRRAFRGEQ